MIRETPRIQPLFDTAKHPDVARATRMAKFVGFGSWVVGWGLFGVACWFREAWLFGVFAAWYLVMAGLVSAVAAIPRELQSRLDRDLGRRFQELSEHDDLTGLFNRRYFNAELEAQISACQRNSAPLSIGLIDLDDFKSINDSFGHPAGDMALRIAGQAIVDVSPAGATVARTGGDEFAVIMPGVQRDAADHVAVRIRQAIEAANFVVDSNVGGRGRIRATVGMATLGDNEDPGQLLQEADSALYAGKRAAQAA
ncbi:MAG: GGDEF domain-containing protein [bacterium]